MKMQRHLATESIDNDEFNRLSAQQAYIPEWDGYDLDRTLAEYYTWKGPLHIGEPIPAMIEHVKATIASGRKVKIFTARVSYDDERLNQVIRKTIEEWCLRHIGQIFEITNVKDLGMRNLYDDRAWHVVPNEGIVVTGKPQRDPSFAKEFHTQLKKELGQD